MTEIPEKVRDLVRRFAWDIASILHTRHDIGIGEDAIDHDDFCRDAVALANGDEIGCADEEEVANDQNLPLNYIFAAMNECKEMADIPEDLKQRYEWLSTYQPLEVAVTEIYVREYQSLIERIATLEASLREARQVPAECWKRLERADQTINELHLRIQQFQESQKLWQATEIALAEARQQIAMEREILAGPVTRPELLRSPARYHFQVLMDELLEERRASLEKKEPEPDSVAIVREKERKS